MKSKIPLKGPYRAPIPALRGLKSLHRLFIAGEDIGNPEQEIAPLKYNG